MFDSVGDDALTALETVQSRYLEVNGEHPLTADDEAHIREHFTPATLEQLVAAAHGQRPLPAYLLADGTPMMADIDDCLEAAGGDGHLHDWFVAFWPDETTAEHEWESFLAGHHVDLRHLDPIFIRNRNQLVAQAQTATQALRNDPRDELAQGALIEAVNGGVGSRGSTRSCCPASPTTDSGSLAPPIATCGSMPCEPSSTAPVRRSCRSALSG